VNDDLAGCTVRPERRQHRASRRGEEPAHWLDKTPSVAHHT
jgi:hypothetical protein